MESNISPVKHEKRNHFSKAKFCAFFLTFNEVSSTRNKTENVYFIPSNNLLAYFWLQVTKYHSPKNDFVVVVVISLQDSRFWINIAHFEFWLKIRICCKIVMNSGLLISSRKGLLIDSWAWLIISKIWKTFFKEDQEASLSLE